MKQMTPPIMQNSIPLDQIISHPRNFRQHPESQLKQLEASYERFGQFRSIVVQAQPTGPFLLVAGHGIAEAMRRKGAKEARCDVLPSHMPETDVDAIMIADNLLPLQAMDDEELLARLLQEQQEAGYDLAALGSDEETLRQMLANLGEETIEPPDDEVHDHLPEDVPTRAKVGDIWQLGRHRIGCLNSLDASDVQRLLSGKAPTFIFSDPPYGLEIVATNGYVGGGEAYDIPFGGVKNRKGDVGGTAAHMRETGKPYIAEQQSKRLGSSNGAKPFGTVGRISYGMKAKPIIEQGKYAPVIGDESSTTAVTAFRLCTELFPKALHIWWGANHYAHALPPSSCWIVWDKENGDSFFADAELAWCSDKSAVRIFRHMWNGLMKDSEKGQRRVHPTQKPVALAEWAFEKYGKENDLIYDPFLGSGMSVVAAENLERTVYGCELSPEYIDVIITRWEQHTGQTAELLERVEGPT